MRSPDYYGGWAPIGAYLWALAPVGGPGPKGAGLHYNTNFQPLLAPNYSGARPPFRGARPQGPTFVDLNHSL